MLAIMNSSKKVQDIVNVIARCRKGIKQFQQQGGGEEFPSLPAGGKQQQQCLHSLPHIPTHVMVFDQLHSGDSGGRTTHTLLCKKLDDGNLSVLLDLYYSIFNTAEFLLQSRYDFSLLHTSSCILRGCFSGRLFPFEVVSWLSVELSKLECASLTTLLDPRDSWVIDDDEHQPLLTPTRDMLLMLITVDSKSISKRVCSKHKRTRTIVKNLSVEDCFSIVDHVVEKDKFSDGGVNENFYRVLSKSGLTATTRNQSLFKIKFLQLADTMGVLDGNSNVLTAKDYDKHLIQMVDSCPQCLSSNTTLNTTVQHMCREIAHSSGTTTIIASGSFEREFDMESFHERVVSCTDLTLPIGNDKYFFYSLTTKPQNMESVGKSMNTLCTESLTALSNTLDDCKHKRDDFRPASENIRTSKLHMCLSRFENPLKRTNNEKGEVKLLNHSKILLGLGGKWITSKVYTELYTVDLMDIKSKVSYIDRSRDYKSFTRPVHKILTKSTLYKLQNYFTSNQRFSVDKKKHPIKLAVIPPDETTTMDLPDQWTVNANVKELLHQWSSIL